jgi:pyruvate dehydrogenase E1 component
MANLFKQVGIYSSVGQRYEPEDIGSVLSYREATGRPDSRRGHQRSRRHRLLDGRGHQLQRAWPADAAVLHLLLDVRLPARRRPIWAAADQRARGFLLGATSGRTTLGGEGLQHQDGSSQLVAATIPNCVAYDPAYAGELAVIVEDGMRRMLEEQRGRVLLRHAHERELRAARCRTARVKASCAACYRHRRTVDAPRSRCWRRDPS